MIVRAAAIGIVALQLAWLPGPPLRAAPETLDQWIDDTLLPELGEVLGEHPRFAGEPVLVRAMRDAEPAIDTDALTRALAERISQGLLARADVALAAHDPALALPADGASCVPATALEYYVGIELDRSGAGQYRFRVRLLDLHEQQWVSGFTWQWRGQLDGAQRQAQAQRSPDERLRGMRALPFEPGHADLLAERLAFDLGCALQAGGADAPSLYLGRGAPLAGLDELPGLVAHQLARRHAVALRPQPAAGALTLRTELYPIDGDVHLVSVIAAAGEGAEPAPAAVAQAYVRVRNGTLAENPPRMASEAFAGTGVPAAQGLLSPPRLVMPLTAASCASPAPWQRGAREVVDDMRVRRGQCFAIELDVTADAQVFVLREPVDCVRGEQHEVRAAAARRLRLVPDDGAAFGWRGGGGYESFYVLAARDARASDELQQQLAARARLCGRRATLEDWIDGLDQLLRRLGDRVDWQALRVEHTS